MENGNTESDLPGRGAWWHWIPLFIALASFVTSDVAFCIAEHNDNRLGLATFLETFYSSAQLLLFHMPQRELPACGPLVLFQIARPLAVLAWAASGLVIMYVFSKQLRLWWTVWKGGHIVICGLSGAGLALAEDARRDGQSVVVIDRESSGAAVIRAEKSGVSMLSGSPVEPRILRKAGVHRAKYLLAARDDDSANIAAVVRAREAARGKPVRAFVHIADPQLRVFFHSQRTFRSEGKTAASVFNLDENSARALLRVHPLDHVRIRPGTEQVVQLIVIGFGPLGEAVLTRAALTGHYANLKPLKAVVIDREANRKGRLFRNRYGHFAHMVAARFIEWDAEEPEKQAHIAALCADRASTISTIVISLDDRPRGLSIALSLHKLLQSYVPIRLRLDDDSGLAALLPEGKITGFGSIREACQGTGRPDSELDAMARKMHEDYLAKLPEAERSQPENRSSYPWDRLDDDLVESNRQLADHIPVKLRAISCDPATRGNPDALGELVDHFEKDEIELLAKLEHKRWMAERFLAGWTSGPKDVETRHSPYLVEWEDLPPNIQEYDRNFVRIIPGLLHSVDKEIRR